MDGVPHLTHEALLEHHSFVLRLAKGILGDDAAAQDVVQESMLTALRNPPKHQGLRAWLANVVHSRAVDRARSDRSRARREQTVARGEATDDSSKAIERLEIQHDVVRALLSQEEPYRALVVAEYYEGLSIAEIARRRGMPESTVRANLKKAREMLRAKLRAGYGDGENGWRRQLMLFADLAERAAPSGGARAPTAASVWKPIWIAASAAALLLTASTWILTRPSATSDAMAASVARQEGAVGGSSGLESTGVAGDRVPMTPLVAATKTLAFDVNALDLDGLLAHSRRLKHEIVSRQPEWSREVVDDRFTNRSDARVVRLAKSRGPGLNLAHPGWAGGHSRYSFTAREFVDEAHAQISVFGGSLSMSTHPRVETWFLDLGDADPIAVRAQADASPRPGDAHFRTQWEAMFAPMSDSAMRTERPLATLWEEALARAVADGRVAEADRSGLAQFRPSSPIRVGSTCLLRTFSRDEFDVLVLITVLEDSNDSCAIGWRLFHDASPVRAHAATTMESAIEPDDSPEAARLRSLTPKQLENELLDVFDRSTELMIRTFDPQVVARYGALGRAKHAGLQRLLAPGSPWGELISIPSLRLHELKFNKSFSTGYDVYPVRLEGSEVRDYALTTPSRCAMVHLGSVGLESLTIEQLSDASDPAVRFLTVESPAGFVPVTFGPQDDPTGDALVAKRAAGADAARATYFEQAIELGATRRVIPQLGHTYLVRSSYSDRRDVLGAITVAQIDRQGLVLAWRSLRNTESDGPR